MQFAQRSEERRPGHSLSDVRSLFQVQFIQKLLFGDFYHQFFLCVFRQRREAAGRAARRAADPQTFDEHLRQKQKSGEGKRKKDGRASKQTHAGAVRASNGEVKDANPVFLKPKSWFVNAAGLLAPAGHLGGRS